MIAEIKQGINNTDNIKQTSDQEILLTAGYESKDEVKLLGAICSANLKRWTVKDTPENRKKFAKWIQEENEGASVEEIIVPESNVKASSQAKTIEQKKVKRTKEKSERKIQAEEIKKMKSSLEVLETKRFVDDLSKNAKKIAEIFGCADSYEQNRTNTLKFFRYAKEEDFKKIKVAIAPIIKKVLQSLVTTKEK